VRIPTFVFKVPVVGDGAVGKTSLILRYTQGVFREDYKITIGTSFAVHIIKLGNAVIKLQIWDLAGQPHFKGVRPLFYRGSTGVIYVFSVTDRNSFQNIPNWVEEVRRIVGDLPSILVGNKTDLVDQRVVTKEEGQALAAQLGFPYIETSAKADLNVGNAFRMISEAIVRARWPQWTPDQTIPTAATPAAPSTPAASYPSPSPTALSDSSVSQSMQSSPPMTEEPKAAAVESDSRPEVAAPAPPSKQPEERIPEETREVPRPIVPAAEPEVPDVLLPVLEEEETGAAGASEEETVHSQPSSSQTAEGSEGELEEFAGVDVDQLPQEEFDERLHRALRRLGVDKGGVLGSYLRDLSRASQRDVVMRTLRSLQSEKREEGR